MKNDKKLVEQMKQLQEETKELKQSIDAWLSNVEFLGNQCASTDRQMERVLDVAINKVNKGIKKVSRLYESQFK